MESVESEKSFFIYDKASWDVKIRAFCHSYSMLPKINIMNIFENDYDFLENNEAVSKFVELFKNVDRILLKEHDYKLFEFYMFKTKTNDYVLVVAVSWPTLAKYIKDGVPFDRELLYAACRNHCYYERESNGIRPMYQNQTSIDVHNNTICKNLMKSITETIADATYDMIEQPTFTIQLFPYQKRNIKWMIDKEMQVEKLYLSRANEIIIDKLVVNYSSKKVLNIHEANAFIELSGGVLSDEVGMGKTIQMVIMSLLDKFKKNPINGDAKQACYTKLFTKGNLIICPTQLCGQWVREFTKVINKTYPLSIIPFYNKIHYDRYTYDDILNANFVVTSFAFLISKHFCNPSWFIQGRTFVASFATTQYESLNVLATELYEADLKKTIKKTNVNLLFLRWNRIIVDEFHEIVNTKKALTPLPIIKLFESNFRWCMSGTPLNQSSESLIEIINFISHAENDISILTNSSVYNHVKNNLKRRNTKKSVETEYKLPPLKETVLKLQFSKTEWLLYNAYLADSTIDRFSPLVRQMCCHPKIATEIKTTLSHCKTLDDIEHVMLSHYKKAHDDAEHYNNYAIYKVNVANEKLKMKTFKFYKRLLKSIGYNPTIDYVIKKFEEPAVAAAIFEKEEEEEEVAIDIDEIDIEESDEEDGGKVDERPKITISEDNIGEIMGLISKLPRFVTRSRIKTKFEEYVDSLKLKQSCAEKSFQGKLRTYTYFKGVLDKLVLAEKTTLINSETPEEDNPNLETCIICLGTISGIDLGVISKCGHIFCYNCIHPYITTHHKCPMCKWEVVAADIFKIKCNINAMMLPTEQEITQNTLINKVGTKIANLIFFLKTTDKHVIIFSQWDDLLKKVGETLTEHGITNLFCRGHVWQRDKAIRDFNDSNTIKVIMLSSESAASGTNLTKAEIVILLDPVYGTVEHRRNTEWQAIGRAYRMGQTKTVEVIRFVIDGTVEQEIYDLNIRHDKTMNINSNIGDMKIVFDNTLVSNIVSSATTIIKKPRKKAAPKTDDTETKTKAKTATKKIVEAVDSAKI